MQKRNKISFSAISAEIKSQFSSSDLDSDMLLVYAKSALALMDYDADTVKDTYLTVDRYKATLPKDYYEFRDAYAIVNNRAVPVRIGEDSDLRRNEDYTPLIPHLTHGHMTIVLHQRHGIIRTSFPSGKLFLIYYALTTDEAGQILLPEEENAIQAVKAYCIMESFREDFYKQKVYPAAFQEMTQRWNDQRALAEMSKLSLSEYDYRMMAAEVENRYSNFNFDKQYII